MLQGPPTRCRGAVKWFNSAKGSEFDHYIQRFGVIEQLLTILCLVAGFGFITLEGTEDEIFVHQARIQFVCINEIGDHVFQPG